jgi:hypothetical protein
VRSTTWSHSPRGPISAERRQSNERPVADGRFDPMGRDRFMACGMVRSSALSAKKLRVQAARYFASWKIIDCDRSHTADQCGTPNTKVSRTLPWRHANMGRKGQYQRPVTKGVVRIAPAGAVLGYVIAKKSANREVVFPPNRRFCDGRHSGRSRCKTRFTG